MLLKALKHKCKYVMLEVFGGKAPLGEYQYVKSEEDRVGTND